MLIAKFSFILSGFLFLSEILFYFNEINKCWFSIGLGIEYCWALISGYLLSGRLRSLGILTAISLILSI
jgi:hypothetical protein